MPLNGRFRIGSATKTFTATVVLQLVGEGRMSLEDTVYSIRVWPSAPDRSSAPRTT